MLLRIFSVSLILLSVGLLFPRQFQGFTVHGSTISSSESNFRQIYNKETSCQLNDLNILVALIINNETCFLL